MTIGDSYLCTFHGCVKYIIIGQGLKRGFNKRVEDLGGKWAQLQQLERDKEDQIFWRNTEILNNKISEDVEEKSDQPRRFFITV